MGSVTSQADVVIVGGGVSGALTAFHLRQLRPQARIVLFDPRAHLGLGQAYSTPSMRHLLNVPADKISALPTQPHHFLHWLRGGHDPEATESTFAPRVLFGKYIRELIAPLTGLHHVQAEVVEATPCAEGATLRTASGELWQARRIVLATGNFDPAPLPGIAPEAAARGLYRHDAWQPQTFSGLDAQAPVALIGTGLTAVDVILRLREQGHRGPILAVSRHGVFPQSHAAYTPATHSAIPAETRPTCVAYLRSLRAAIAGGMAWRAAIDSLRASTNDLWLALPLAEQRRFRRHLQRRWDVVRHRMAPSIAAVLDAERAAGTLSVLTGTLRAITADTAHARVTIQTHSGRQHVSAARVINCTGPDMQYRRVASPLLQQLLAAGLASAGPLGAGLATAANGAVIQASGNPSPFLFTLGPSRQGTLLESIAIPELRQQAFDLARLLAQGKNPVAAAHPGAAA